MNKELICEIVVTKQNDYDIFTFPVNAKSFLEFVHFKSRSEDQENGVQRPFDSKRSRIIAEAIDSGDLFIPNSIIVNLKLRENELKLSDILTDDKKYLDLNKAKQILVEKGIAPRELFFVIDGQHRLRAFEYVETSKYNLIVTSFIDLYISEVADIFVQINYNQKPVNKSLAYDLLGITERVFPGYKLYHNVVDRLNSDVDSPFFDEIKMIGTGPGLISQASIISAIEKYRLEKRLGYDEGKIEEDKFYLLLKIYFNSIKITYNEIWNSKSTILTKSIGLRSMFKFMPDLINHMEKHSMKFDIENINRMLTRIDSMIVDYAGLEEKDSSNMWQYLNTLGVGGEGGISTVHRLLVSTLEVVSNG